MRSLSCGERAILNQDADTDPDFGPQPIRVTKRTARKPHPCDVCSHGGILPGEAYTELVFLRDEDGHFKIERHCHIVGCKRSDEQLEHLSKEQARAAEEYFRNNLEEGLF